MATLLKLPAELRLKIYDLAISSRPNIINVDEGATSNDPPRSSAARSLAQVDKQLSGEMMPLYWSCNIFEAYRLTGMGHYISTDRTFHRWLRDVVKDSVRYVRHLRFKGARTAASEEMHMHESECIMTVDVDLRRRKTCMWDKTGETCRCDHARALQSRMEAILKHIPFVEGQLRPSSEILWTLFESWYVYNPLRATTLRSWDEFQRQSGVLSGE